MITGYSIIPLQIASVVGLAFSALQRELDGGRRQVAHHVVLFAFGCAERPARAAAHTRAREARADSSEL
jgi:hypothetical protein